MSLFESIKLNNGVEMPVFGLGTFLTKEENTYDLLKAALDIGYRHFDTAIVYENHK